jgi:hypothetical protein
MSDDMMVAGGVGEAVTGFDRGGREKERIGRIRY